MLLDVSPDLDRLLVATGPRVDVVDAETLLPIARTTGDGDAILYARFLEGGKRFLTIDRERTSALGSNVMELERLRRARGFQAR